MLCRSWKISEYDPLVGKVATGTGPELPTSEPSRIDLSENRNSRRKVRVAVVAGVVALVGLTAVAVVMSQVCVSSSF